jgi:hypothetical protein
VHLSRGLLLLGALFLLCALSILESICMRRECLMYSGSRQPFFCHFVSSALEPSLISGCPGSLLCLSVGAYVSLLFCDLRAMRHSISFCSHWVFSGDRRNAQDVDFTHLLTPEQAEAIRQAAGVSMGTNLGREDLQAIIDRCGKVLTPSRLSASLLAPTRSLSLTLCQTYPGSLPCRSIFSFR